MSFGPWQSAFRNISKATRRIRVGGIATKKPRRKPAPEGSPRARGRRFRTENETDFDSGIAAYLLAVMLTPLFYVVPTSQAPAVGVVIAVLASIPIVRNRYSFPQKCMWLLPLYIPALILILTAPETTGWTIVN